MRTYTLRLCYPDTVIERTTGDICNLLARFYKASTQKPCLKGHIVSNTTGEVLATFKNVQHPGWTEYTVSISKTLEEMFV